LGGKDSGGGRGAHAKVNPKKNHIRKRYFCISLLRGGNALFIAEMAKAGKKEGPWFRDRINAVILSLPPPPRLNELTNPAMRNHLPRNVKSRFLGSANRNIF
jgi:hypothetical protein